MYNEFMQNRIKHSRKNNNNNEKVLSGQLPHSKKHVCISGYLIIKTISPSQIYIVDNYAEIRKWLDINSFATAYINARCWNGKTCLASFQNNLDLGTGSMMCWLLIQPLFISNFAVASPELSHLFKGRTCSEFSLSCWALYLIVILLIPMPPSCSSQSYNIWIITVDIHVFGLENQRYCYCSFNQILRVFKMKW